MKKIVVLKTCDGPVYFSLTKEGKRAAVRLLIDQLRKFGHETYAMEGDEPKEMIQVLETIINPYDIAIREHLLQECSVRSS